MPIISVSRWKGNYEQGLPIARRAAEIQKRHGVTSVQVGTCYSGPDTGQLYSVITFPDRATFGRFQQAVAADAEFQRLMAEGLQVLELQDRSAIVAEGL
jgi:hypothetical protein